MIVLADIQQQYIGCYKDGGSPDRVMTGATLVSGSMTIEMCQQRCQSSVNTYFGLEVIRVTATLCKIIRLFNFYRTV